MSKNVHKTTEVQKKTQWKSWIKPSVNRKKKSQTHVTFYLLLPCQSQWFLHAVLTSMYSLLCCGKTALGFTCLIIVLVCMKPHCSWSDHVQLFTSFQCHNCRRREKIKLKLEYLCDRLDGLDRIMHTQITETHTTLHTHLSMCMQIVKHK